MAQQPGMIAVDRNGELDDMEWRDELTEAWELSRLAVSPEF